MSEPASVQPDRRCRLTRGIVAAVNALGERNSAVIAFVLALVVNVAFRLYRDAPMIAPDELGYLAAAQYIVGLTPLNLGAAPYYSFGSAIVMLPSFWLFSDPTDIYTGIMFTNGILCALVVPIAYVLMRQLGAVGHNRILFASFILACWPGYLYPANFAHAEPFFRAVFLCMCVLFVHGTARSHFAALAAAGIAAALLYAAHPRGLALPGVALFWITSAAFLGQVERAKAFAASAITVFAAGLVYGLHQHFESVLASGFYSHSDHLRGVLFGLAEPENALRSVVVLLGQTWYQVAGSLGIIVLGCLLTLRFLVLGDRAQQISSGFILAAVVSVLGASVLQMSTPARLDHVIYGRYVDGASVALFCAGLAALLRPSTNPTWIRNGLFLAILMTIVIALVLYLTPFVADLTPAHPNNVGSISAFISWSNDAAETYLITSLWLLFAMISLMWLTQHAGRLAIIGIYVAISFGVLWPRLATQSEEAAIGRDRLLAALDTFEKGSVFWDSTAKQRLGLYSVQFVRDDYFLNWPEDLGRQSGDFGVLSTERAVSNLHCITQLQGGVFLHRQSEIGGPISANLGEKYPFNMNQPFLPCASGWSGVERWGRWNAGQEARLQVSVESDDHQLVDLVLDGRVLIRGASPVQHVRTHVNGEIGPEFSLNEDRAVLRIPIRAGGVANEITLRFPDAVQPSLRDSRELAFGVHWLCVVPTDHDCN